MDLSLPSPIQAYFAGNETMDVDAMLACFEPQAVVRDERREHRGTTAIRAWIVEATVGNQAVATPTAIKSGGDRHSVTARVVGAFPGSPLVLSFDFRLDEDRIMDLEIG